MDNRKHLESLASFYRKLDFKLSRLVYLKSNVVYLEIQDPSNLRLSVKLPLPKLGIPIRKYCYISQERSHKVSLFFKDYFDTLSVLGGGFWINCTIKGNNLIVNSYTIYGEIALNRKIRLFTLNFGKLQLPTNEE